MSGREWRGRDAPVRPAADVSERRAASFGQKRSLMTTCLNTTVWPFKLNTDSSRRVAKTCPQNGPVPRFLASPGEAGGGARCCTGWDQMGADRRSLVFHWGNSED